MSKAYTREDLESYRPLEFIIVLGSAGSGKSHAILDVAEAWQDLKPSGTVYILDIEEGIRKIWKEEFPDVHNIKMWHAGGDLKDIDDFLEVFNEIWPQCKATDWLCIESDTKVWDWSQDNAWLRVTGQRKDAYLSSRLAKTAGGKSSPVTPQPDYLWQVALNYYRRQFRDVLVNEVRHKTNVFITTGVSPKSPRVSLGRKDSMAFLGITDIVADGHSENVRNPDSVALLTSEGEDFWAFVLKDRGHKQRRRFRVDNFWLDFVNSRTA